MATSESEELHRRRRGYWLRLARRRADMTLKEVAVAMGYSLSSQSTIKLWEDGRRDPSDIQLNRLAGVYGIPVEIFIDPDSTDEERMEARIREALTARNRRAHTG